MYAVIRTGGKQVRVAQGDVVRIERLSGRTFAKGDEIAMGEILAIGNEGGLKLGNPLVSGASVKGIVVREMRAPKVFSYKKKKRKGFQRIHGHRQNLLEVRIDSITT